MKCLGCILQTKWHPEIFEQPERGNDRSLRDVRGVDGDLMIAPDQINFAEDGLASEIRGKIMDPRYRVFVVLRLAI